VDSWCGWVPRRGWRWRVSRRDAHLGSMRYIGLTAVLLLAACGDSTTAPVNRLGEQRALWASQGLADYTFDVKKVCECLFVGDVRVTVKDGVITGVTELASEVARDPETFRTIDGLFDLVQDAYDRDAHEVQVEFDPGRGYPTRIWIDYVLMIADEEIGFTLLSDVTVSGD
jgi:hypothetical protein